jgi:hypothetical protein
MGQSTSSWPYDCPSPIPQSAPPQLRPYKRPRHFSDQETNKANAAEEACEGGEQNREDGEDYDQEGSEEDAYDRDVQGRKHVCKEINRDGAYVINTHESRTLVRFPLAGKVADSKFRAYLQTYIPSHMLLDEYGHVQPIRDISSSHIASIQAKLWCEIPQSLTARSSVGTEDVTDYDRRAANCIESIADTLKSKLFFQSRYQEYLLTYLLVVDHVFVVRHRPLNAPLCSFGLCSELHYQLKMLHEPEPKIVSLEPTVAFMTLDPASDLHLFNGNIFVFRRISAKYSEYGVNVENIIPKERLAYCIECLQYLWDRRIHAWLTKEKFGDRFEGSQHCFRAINHSFDSQSSHHSLQHRVTRHTTPLDLGENKVYQDNAEDVERHSDDDGEEDEEICTIIPRTTSQEKRSLSQMLSSEDRADNGDVGIEQHPFLGDPATDNTITPIKPFFHLDGVIDEPPNTPQKPSAMSEKITTPLGVHGLKLSNTLSPRALRALAREWSAAKLANAQRVNNKTRPFSVYTPPQWNAINNPPNRLSTSNSALRQISSNQSTAQPTIRAIASREELEYFDDQMDPTLNQSLQGTFDLPDSEQYRGARAGAPIGDPVQYRHKKGISFPAPPMQDLGPMFLDVSVEEPHMERPERYGGAVTRKLIISSAVRVLGVKISNQELKVPSPARNRFKPVPQSITGARVSPIAPSALRSISARGNSLQTSLVAAKIEKVLLTAKPVNASLDPNTKNSTSSTSASLRMSMNPMVFSPAVIRSRLSSVKPVNLGPLALKSPNLTSAASFQRHQRQGPKVQALPSAQVARHLSLQAAQYPQNLGKVPAAPILCYCRKPSRPDDRIVTCFNINCPISRYHYRCLDKSQKLSTKGVKWKCAMCKAAAMYAEKAAKQPKTDFKFPFNRKEVEDAFAFTGEKAGHNPYGFSLGKYNGYQPEKYGVMGHTTQNGEARIVYGVDPNAENLDEESEASEGESSDDEDDDFIVMDEELQELADSSRQGQMHQNDVLVHSAAAAPSSSPVPSPSPPSTPTGPLKVGMKRVYAVDSPIPLALRTWEVVHEDEAGDTGTDTDEE